MSVHWVLNPHDMMMMRRRRRKKFIKIMMMMMGKVFMPFCCE